MEWCRRATAGALLLASLLLVNAFSSLLLKQRRPQDGLSSFAMTGELRRGERAARLLLSQRFQPRRAGPVRWQWLKGQVQRVGLASGVDRQPLKLLGLGGEAHTPDIQFCGQGCAWDSF